MYEEEEITFRIRSVEGQSLDRHHEYSKVTLIAWLFRCVGRVPYQEAVGGLLYLAQVTRPYIAFAVNDVSRFNANHNDVHWSAVKHIYRYLSGTIDLKLKYTKTKTMDLHVFCDADWALDMDKRRSRTGFVTKVSGTAISWMSKRQPIIALSSTEADYIAISSAVGGIIWMKQMADEINAGVVKRVTLYCDNQNTIKLAESVAFRPRTKHIDIAWHVHIYFSLMYCND